MNVALTPPTMTPPTTDTLHNQSNTHKKKGLKHFLKKMFKKKVKQQESHQDEDPQITPAYSAQKKKLGMKSFFKNLFGFNNTTEKQPPQEPLVCT